MVYQCLEALLHYCNAKVATLVLSHLCTAMCNYDLVSNVVDMRHASHHFIEFVATWLQYRKMNCHDTPWNARSLRKSPFDAALDQLKEYSVFVNEKGLKDDYLKLQCVVSTIFAFCVNIESELYVSWLDSSVSHVARLLHFCSCRNMSEREQIRLAESCHVVSQYRFIFFRRSCKYIV